MIVYIFKFVRKQTSDYNYVFRRCSAIQSRSSQGEQIIMKPGATPC